MTEEDARSWLESKGVSRETLQRLDRLVEAVLAEGEHQNLISASTIQSIWVRHIADSAQLLDQAPPEGSWCDLGSGAGFPGLVIAAVGNRPVTLIESRTKRSIFLRQTADAMGIAPKVNVLSRRAEMVQGSYDVISARAFAPLARLFSVAQHLSTEQTRWLLPKGRSASVELVEAQQTWHGDFTLLPSITDAAASILVARNVSRRSHP